MENFEYQVIELCSVEELDAKEIYWINKLDTLSPKGYNILPGGQKTRASTRILFCKKCGKEICKDNESGLCRSCVQIKTDISKVKEDISSINKNIEAILELLKSEEELKE